MQGGRKEKNRKSLVDSTIFRTTIANVDDKKGKIRINDIYCETLLYEITQKGK